MAILSINTDPDSRQLRRFAGTFLLALGAWAALAYFRWQSPTAAGVLLALATSVGAVGLLWPGAVRWLYLAMNYAVWPIGVVLSMALLVLVYYAVMTPIALVMRLIGYDPLKRRIDRSAKSYWERRTPNQDVERYFKQY